MSNSKEPRVTYLGTAAAFLGLAVTMWITMDSWAVALPFVAIAVTFTIIGARPARLTDSEPDEYEPKI